MSDELPVLARVEGRLGRLTLNRPRALHALTTQMCALMTGALLAWRDDPAVSSVMIDHAGERGFCAGGDIRMVAQSGAGDGAAGAEFFLTEYRLNHLLFVYPKPLVAVMDGVVMGGGAGLSLPCSHRIATERTLFAMPETGIGLFPDVGGGWFLPRLPSTSGVWLGLTGARLKAAECLALGLATDYVDLASLKTVRAALADGADPKDALAPSASVPPAAGLTHHPRLAALFGGTTVQAVLATLAADGSDWARTQHATLLTKSPLSMAVSLRHMRAGAGASSFAEVMRNEFRIANRMMRQHDFQEGVRALIVDKDNAPRWTPADIADVPDALLDSVFAPLGHEWTPLPGVA